MDRDIDTRPGDGPLDEPDRDANDPIGGDAYTGGGGMLPPTGDMDDPPPSTGVPGNPPADEPEEGPAT